MNLFDNIKFTPEEDEALSDAAASEPLDDPADEVAVQEARAKLVAEKEPGDEISGEQPDAPKPEPGPADDDTSSDEEKEASDDQHTES